jgi:hypothetical protein
VLVVTYPLLLLTETSSGRWEADRIEGVPVVAPVTIVLVAGSPEMEEAVGGLRAEILNILSSSGPELRVDAVAPPGNDDPSEWPGCANADRLKILTLVCSAAGPAVDRPWFRAWLQGAPDRSTLPLFEAGANPSELMPVADLQKLNASFWKDAPSECVPAIFSRVGLTVSEQRVFISYRRIETQPLAEQLFDTLTHDGFDVFVDRFSVDPGVDFQRRLDQELADKSMVVLLESAAIEASKWTQHEIDYTKKFRLGLLALQLPDRQRPLPSIDVDLRKQLTKEDFLSEPTQVQDPQTKGLISRWGPLNDDPLARIVALVKSVHDAAIFRRRRYLRAMMDAALAAAQLTPDAATPDGLVTVRNANGTCYAIWLTTRPPELGDFYTTQPRTLHPPSTGVIVGPTSLLEPAREACLKWLTGICKFVCVDEDDLTEVAVRIGRNAL